MAYRVTKYAFKPPRWPEGLHLRAVALADIHSSWPWMTVARIQAIVDQANALKPDVFLLLGDYGHAVKLFGRPIPHKEYAAALAGLSAPLGIHAVLGNHDWTDDPQVKARGHGPTQAGEALMAAGIAVHENTCARLKKDGRVFWIAGLGDQRVARLPRSERKPFRKYRGVDDLTGTLSQIEGEAPVILLAHEPDIFPEVPDRISLTLSGHTHAGQVNLFGWTPVVPSHFGCRYVYGHIVEQGRHLIVSSGLGYSKLPIRFNTVPEIVLLDIGEQERVAQIRQIGDRKR
jgi:predicted MPP superfamily phosphohydrolase